MRRLLSASCLLLPACIFDADAQPASRAQVEDAVSNCGLKFRDLRSDPDLGGDLLLTINPAEPQPGQKADCINKRLAAQDVMVTMTYSESSETAQPKTGE